MMNRFVHRMRVVLVFISSIGLINAQPYYPVVGNKELDCQIRLLGYNYSQYLQPYRDISSVFRSLQLDSYCNFAKPTINSYRNSDRFRDNISFSTVSFYVDALYGNDANNGNESNPFLTIPYAVQRCQQTAGSSVCTVILRDSAPFFISSPIYINSSLNNQLQITAYPGESPALTGSFSLTNLTWTIVNTTNPMNIYKTKLSNFNLQPFNTLLFQHQRYIRARYPNGNPETDLVPDGYTNATSWLPPRPPLFPAVPIINQSVNRPEDHYFPNYTWAVNGTAVGYFDPPEGYWIHPNPPGGVPFVVPSGFTFSPDKFSPRVSSWTDIDEAIVHVFHGIYWGNWQFYMDQYNPLNHTIIFGSGGFQEARGDTAGGALYVENIFQELDYPGEWYYNSSSSELYVFYNGTGTPPTTGWSVSQTATLLIIEGTSTDPLQNIIINGLTFTETSSVFLEPFRAPSGGDWSYRNSASVIIEGTEETVIQECRFEKLGGTGILVRGYNRQTQIMNNSFNSLGDSGIISAGYSNYTDASNGIAPIGTIIQGNLFQKFGIFVKQSGAYYSAISGNTTIRENVMFESSRALINVNDGAYGGHLIERNVFFNAVTETADHGAVNTWNRMPFVWKIENNQPVIDPLPITLRQNLFINSYYGIHSMDHDDGSYAMIDTENVIAFAGMKNFEGFAKITTGNLFVAPDFMNSTGKTLTNPVTPSGVPLPVGYYFPACARSVGQYTWGTTLADQYTNNSCILIGSTSPYLFGECNPQEPSTSGEIPITGNNSFITSNGQLTIHCGNTVLNLTEAQKVGMDTGSTVVSTKDAQLDTPIAIAVYMGKFLGMY